MFLFVDSADAAEPPVLEILNAKQAENFGIEVEGMLAAARGLGAALPVGPAAVRQLRLAARRVHRLRDDARVPDLGGVGAVSVPVDYSGKRLQNAPEYKASGTAEWTFDLGRFGYLIPRYDINWSDDVFFDPNEGRGSVDPDRAVPRCPNTRSGRRRYFLHNVRLAYRTPTGNVEFAGWVRNVEDEVYKNFAFDASRFTGHRDQLPGRAAHDRLRSHDHVLSRVSYARDARSRARAAG